MYPKIAVRHAGTIPIIAMRIFLFIDVGFDVIALRLLAA